MHYCHRVKSQGLTGVGWLQGGLPQVHLVIVADADAAVNLVEQGRAQVGELAGRDAGVWTQAIVVEELGQIQTLAIDEGGRKRWWTWVKRFKQYHVITHPLLLSLCKSISYITLCIHHT